ncbi:hypothetical protein JCM6882_002092 [Rhodosporidiobolus microsporus]
MPPPAPTSQPLPPTPSPRPQDDGDSPLLYRSPRSANAHRLSRTSFAPHPPPAASERPPRRRPISLRDPPKGRAAATAAAAMQGEEEEGEGEGDEESYWRGEVQRRPSVGLGLKFGLEGWEIGEEDEGEARNEDDERAAMSSTGDPPLTAFPTPPSASSPCPSSLSPPLSPISLSSPNRLSTYTATTTSTSASPSRSRQAHGGGGRPGVGLSRYSSSGASAASTAATSVHDGDSDDDDEEEGKDSPVEGPAPARRFTYSTSSRGRETLAVPSLPRGPLTPDTFTETAAFDFPLPPGVVIPSLSPSLTVEQPSPLADEAAASFALPCSSSSSSPTSSPRRDDEDAGTTTRLPSYSSTISPLPFPFPPSSSSSHTGSSSSRTHASRHHQKNVVQARPLDPWALDPGAEDGLDEEDRAVLGAVLPAALEAGEESAEEEYEEEQQAARSPRLIPLSTSPAQGNRLAPPPTARSPTQPHTPPNRSPSMPSISPSLSASQPSSSSRFGNLLSKSPSFTLGGASSSSSAFPSTSKPPSPLLSPPTSPENPASSSSKRSSMLLSPLLAGIGSLSRSRSKSNAGRDKDKGAAKDLRSISEGGTGSSTSSSSSGARSVTDQLAANRLLSPASPQPSSLAPSLLPAHDLDVDPAADVDTLRASASSAKKAAKMLGVDPELVLRSSSSASSSLSRSARSTPAGTPSGSVHPSLEVENAPFFASSSSPQRRKNPPAPLDLLPPVGASPGSPARASPVSAASASKAAKMLGLSEEEVGKAVLSPRGARGAGAGAEGGAAVRGARRWPSQREGIREWEIFSGDLYKLSSTASTLLRQGKLTYRPRIVTLSYVAPPSSSSPPFPPNPAQKPSFFLSTYPTPALLESETSRLTLLPSSHISAPLEGETLPLSRGGRAFALKVTGVVDALANDGSGRIERRKGAWVLGVDDQQVWAEWMGRLRGAVRELQDAATTPLSASRSTFAHAYESAASASSPHLATETAAETFDLDSARLNAAASIRSGGAGEEGAAKDFAETAKATLSSRGWSVTSPGAVTGPGGAVGGASGLVRRGTGASSASGRSAGRVSNSGGGHLARSRNPSLAASFIGPGGAPSIHSLSSAHSVSSLPMRHSLGGKSASAASASRASSILDLTPYASYAAYADYAEDEYADVEDDADFYAHDAAERYSLCSGLGSVEADGEARSLASVSARSVGEERTAKIPHCASFLDAESSDEDEDDTAAVSTSTATNLPPPPPTLPPPHTALPPLPPPSAAPTGALPPLPLPPTAVPEKAPYRRPSALHLHGALPPLPPPAVVPVTRA